MYLAYKKYCQTPNLSTSQDLLDAAISFDMSGFLEMAPRLLEVYRFYFRSHQGDFCFMRTNGTTSGQPSYYWVGPVSTFWFKAIFRHIAQRVKGTARLLIVNEPSSRLVKEDDKNCIFYAPLFRDSVVQDIINTIESFQCPVAVQGMPSVFLYLTSDAMFESFVISNPQHMIMSSDWEPFYKKKSLVRHGVYVNDNMMSWYEGLNFYTCQYGNRHFLPLFVPFKESFFNLVNLVQPTGGCLSDYCEFGEPFMCVCGKTTLKSKFIPHVQHAIRGKHGYVSDVSIVEKLKSQYRNLQFIQRQDDVVEVCFNAVHDMFDYDVIKSFFDDNGLRVEFYKDRFYKFGRKLLTFRRCEETSGDNFQSLIHYI